MSGALSSVRVLDLGIITAGAATSALLADLGAEVIKIEGRRYSDPFRVWTGPESGGSPFFRATNRNKSGLSLDLKDPRGRAVFLTLVACSDVVVENFRRGVLESLGLDFETLKAANPRIILASISSQGETGPLAGYVSFGTTLEAMSGMASLGGYPEGGPMASGHDMNYPDQVVALFGAGMISTALLARRDGGGAVHLDLSQRELTSFLCGEAFIGDVRGEDSAGADPAVHMLEDIFLSADHRWVALSVRPDQAAPLVQLCGSDGPAALSRWIGSHDANAAVGALQLAGIAAEVVVGGADAGRLAEAARSMALRRWSDGFLMKGFPFQLHNTPLEIRSDAPNVGQDSERVLVDLAGLTPAEIADLAEAGVI